MPKNNTKQEYILITGATGFIGSHLFREFKKQGEKVIGVSKEGGMVEGHKILKLDLLNSSKVTDFFKKFPVKVVYHLAAFIPKTTDFSDQIRALNENTLAVINVIKSSLGVNRIVYASSVAILGWPVKKVDENSPIRPRDFYALSKFIGEKIIEEWAKDRGKSFSILRISAPYGPGQKRQTVVSSFLDKALNSKDITVFGQGKRQQDFIYISDIVRAFKLSLKNKNSGVYNIGSGVSTSSLNLAKLVLKVTSSKSKIKFSGPDPEEGYCLELNIQKACKDLGFKPQVSLEEGLKNMIKHMR